MEKVLFACDELTGLIGAAALMRPSKSVSDMELKSLKKKFKDKKFAAGCSRDVIAQGAEMLGWDLDKLLDLTLSAMRMKKRSLRPLWLLFNRGQGLGLTTAFSHVTRNHKGE